MASNDTELKLKLAAEGGAASAKEVGSVKEAAAQLADVMAELRAEMLDAGKSIDETESALAPLQEQLNAIVDAMSDQAEQEAAAEALREQAKAMADAAQAAATLRAEQEEAAAIAKAQADAFEAEQAELKRLAEAYEAAQIAAAELAVKQAEQAEAEKAKEIKNQEAALENLGKSVRAMIPGYSALMERVTRLREAWKLASASGASFGQKLTALAGGPVAIGVAAFAALTAGVAAYRARLAQIKAEGDAVDARLKALAESAKAQGEAAAESAIQSRDYSAALDDLAKTHERNKATWETAIALAEQQAKAQDDLARATIDRRVAEGEISKEEGAALKYEADIQAIERELAAERERAALERSRADETARLANAAEQEARQRADRAEEAAAQERARQNQFEQRSQGARIKANQLLDAGFTGANSAGLIEALGGEDAVRRMIADLGTDPRAGFMDRLAGGVARTDLAGGVPLEKIVEDKLFRDALAKQLNKEAELATKAAEAREESIANLEKKAAKEKELLEAASEEAAAAKESAAKAKAAQDNVAAREKIARDYTIPAIETRADTARGEEQRNKDEEAKKAYEAGQKDLDKSAVGLAKELGGMLASRGSGAENSEIGREIAHMIQMLNDGTSQNESGTVSAMIQTLMTSLRLTEQTRNELRSAKAEIDRIHAAFRQLESQNQAARR